MLRYLRTMNKTRTKLCRSALVRTVHWHRKGVALIPARESTIINKLMGTIYTLVRPIPRGLLNQCCVE